jgi:hypothetical protein
MQQVLPIVCFYCNKPNHKAADCFYKFKDERKQIKLSHAHAFAHASQVISNGGMSPRLSSNFTRPIQPLHPKNNLNSRMGHKYYKVATPSTTMGTLQNFQSLRKQTTLPQRRNPFLHPFHQDIPPNVSPTQEPCLRPSGEEVFQNMRHSEMEGEKNSVSERTYNEHEDSALCAPCEEGNDSGDFKEDDFAKALFYMAQERNRLGPILFRDMPCATLLGEKIHKALVDCEQNIN